MIVGAASLSISGSTFPPVSCSNFSFSVILFFQKIVDIFSDFVFKVFFEFEIFIPLRLRITAVAAFYVGHSLFDIDYALSKGKRVAKLNKAIVIVVNGGFKKFFYFFGFVFGNICLTQIRVEILRMKRVRHTLATSVYPSEFIYLYP